MKDLFIDTDGDGIPQIFNMILNLMEYIDTTLDISGKQKKEFVERTLQEKIGLSTYKRYEPMINQAIDFICSISKKDIKIGINKTKMFCHPLFKSCR